MANPVVHFEIGCRDKATLQNFYTSLFDWHAEEKGPATMLRTGSDVGGHLTELGHEPHNYTLFYVQVDSLEEALQKVASLGGNKIVGPAPVPDGSRFAWIRDPEGNAIGLYEPKRDQDQSS